MKMMRYICTLPLIVFFSLVVLSLKAQPGEPPPDIGAPVPITGIEILIGAGALLGAKKMMAHRKSNP